MPSPGSPQTPEAQHEAAPRQPHADLPPERCLCLGDVELKFKEKEKENQLEVGRRVLPGILSEGGV